MTTAIERVNAFYRVTLEEKNADKLRDYFADDFVFVGPLAECKGAEAAVELNRGFLPAMIGYRMHQQFERGNEVCSIYELELHAPAGGVLAVTMADWIKLQGDRLLEQRVYYDAREFERQMAMAAAA